MVVKCKFCDYHKTQKLDLVVLQLFVDAVTNRIKEDAELYSRELFGDTREWNGVKIHMGRMHKDDTYYGIWPDIKHEAQELRVLETVK